MIKSFKCKETEKVKNGIVSTKLPRDIQKKAHTKLNMLDVSTCIQDLRVPPSNHLEALKGDRKGQHSIAINSQFRICFVWKDNNTHNVEIVDYH